RLFLGLLAAFAVGGCLDDKPTRPTKLLFGGDRPVMLEVPHAYDPSRPIPLVLLLHGYGASGIIEEAYLDLHGLVDSVGILMAAPDGTVNQMNVEFWNATDACCDFDNTPVDDVA